MDGPWAQRRSSLKEKRNQISVLDVLPCRDQKMTLQRFHNVTADVDEGQLRQAMTVALASEIPRMAAERTTIRPENASSPSRCVPTRLRMRKRSPAGARS